MASHHKPRALIYACSGCSDVAQLANSVALRLDHAGEAECPALLVSAVACPVWYASPAPGGLS
ncbi:putative zinc-binding protein [Vreelandella lionensis]|uniref:putative zinc-binding protein n=1 Tax=Vreelandella lionensis TaxID=1144478 RepID=UPI00243730C7|nr:putative zinc-binding protein [Halomonas lionensis]